MTASLTELAVVLPIYDDGGGLVRLDSDGRLTTVGYMSDQLVTIPSDM